MGPSTLYSTVQGAGKKEGNRPVVSRLKTSESKIGAK
uniref:Uncharacterized protein n=1 Tax=Romanomermis culicivorax TaxID=13658 RepID=A0A915I3W3_ROMCU